MFTSHLDLGRVWERSLRRGRVPLVYSQGYNPRPRLQLAAALPLGHTGAAEMIDVWLEGSMRAEEFLDKVIPELPEGLAIGRARLVGDREPALSTQVVAAEYRVTVEWDEPEERVDTRIKRVLEASELPHERRGRRYDMRPLIERLWREPRPPFEGRGSTGDAEETVSEVVLGMQLAARQGATGRPEAVLDVLGMEGAFARYHRQRLVLAGLAA